MIHVLHSVDRVKKTKMSQGHEFVLPNFSFSVFHPFIPVDSLAVYPPVVKHGKGKSMKIHNLWIIFPARRPETSIYIGIPSHV